MNRKERNIWISDITHTEQGIVSRVFPLGVASIYSYSKQELGNEFNFKLFKFPSDLNDSLREKSPTMLCFSNFVWNFQISYKFAAIAKQRDPNVIIVFGGPNFPVEISEKKDSAPVDMAPWESAKKVSAGIIFMTMIIYLALTGIAN